MIPTSLIPASVRFERGQSAKRETLPAPAIGRPCVRGKFIFVGEEKLYVKGVSYGPFCPTADGCEYHDPQTVRADFSLMKRSGINAVRTYTSPPRWLLDIAAEQSLRVMVGLAWEQHVAFLDNRQTAREIELKVRGAVRDCAEHPALLSYTVGNEIPSAIARWYGRQRLERFIRRLYLACKEEDPQGLVTYANYPSTEYLELPFLDFASFNVYLESQAKLEAYLARLQNVACDRPLVVTELGLDGKRHGAEQQARSLEWQTRTVFSSGCAGLFIFSWTDEWFRGGWEIEGWEFGLTTRSRLPKPALRALGAAFEEVPFAPQVEWPKVSVVVCTYNGGRTLRDCLEGIKGLDYPNYETIVVDDGSRDGCAQIAEEYSARVIRTPNRGLSSARNTGMYAAAGEIVAYLDDDARPDRQWLKYLAATFLKSKHAGVGGPNIAPAGDGFSADCVAHAPGGPNHVLLTDSVAEHVPGCNMAFVRKALMELGGFDEQFRIAGDDVDVCWRLQEKGATLGFSPSAMVWHHRRNSLRAYWKQQFNYGRAEAMLERKWPLKYNALGNPTWSGRLYGRGLLQALGWKGSRIYHGTWGSALFQSVYHTAPGVLRALPTTPEWYLIVAVLVMISAWGLIWTPLLLAAPLLGAAAGVSAIQAVLVAFGSFQGSRYATDRAYLWRARLVATWLHLIQPAGRLLGRMRTGLTPWRRRGPGGWSFPWRRKLWLWSETGWRSLEDRLREIETSLRRQEAVVVRGGDFDDWDMEIRGGLMGSVRLRMTVEEHGQGRQMVRMRASPHCSRGAGLVAILMIAICDAAAFGAAWGVWATAGVVGLGLLFACFRETGSAMAAVMCVARGWKRG